MDDHPLRREFRERGYVMLRSLFSTDESEKALSEILRAEPLKPGPSRLDKSGLRFYHNIFQKSPYLQSFITQQKVVDLLTAVVGTDLWARWDQAVAKGPGGEEFPWHQDNGYNQLKREHFQFWVALTDMTRENGVLWLQPGSHKKGRLPHKWIENHLVCEEPAGEEVAIEAKKGDVVLFSSLMLHRTSPNRTKNDRVAYVVEYMSLDHFDPYIEPPYFLVSSKGKSAPRFVRSHPTRMSRENVMLYWRPRMRNLFKKNIRRPLGRILSGLRTRLA
jgi:ectoine hydroxylase-related dioxygenase (phytanoyl-CoA dioxygenase family)